MFCLEGVAMFCLEELAMFCLEEVAMFCLGKMVMDYLEKMMDCCEQVEFWSLLQQRTQYQDVWQDEEQRCL